MTEIRYKLLESRLLKMGYSGEDILHLYDSVQEMDDESRAWVNKWLSFGMLPTKEVEGVTAQYLIEEYHYAPLNALIILDWLKNDPQAAKYFLMKGLGDAKISDSVIEEMKGLIEDLSPATEEENSGAEPGTV